MDLNDSVVVPNFTITTLIVRYGAKLITVGADQQGSDIPGGIRLEQNYPNPFNLTTTISFSLPSSGSRHAQGRDGVGPITTLSVYDGLGREVATLVKEQKQPGTYAVTFDAGDLPSGVYFYRLTAAGRHGTAAETRKLLLLK
jgi:hypothetical protein